MAETIETIRCGCVTGQLPLWGYCDDDLYCPLCGQRIAQLKSTQELSNPKSPLRIYGQPGNGFAFSLSLDYGGPDRSVKSRNPRIDVERSSLLAQTWFQTRLAVPDVKAGNRLFCRLNSREGLDAPVLPSTGLDSDITLVGDFGRFEFPVLICNRPEIVVELTGKGIEFDQAGNWKIWLNEPLELELKLRATTAPIIIDEDIDEILVIDSDALRGLPPVTAELKNKLRKGTQLVPAGTDSEFSEEWSSPLLLDCSSFGTAGRNCQLILDIRLLGIDTFDPVILVLNYVDSGHLEFEPATLTIPLAYVGEVRSNSARENPEPTLIIPRWFIKNIGQQDITVRIDDPDLETRPDAGAIEPKWATVGWAAARDTGVESVLPDNSGAVTLAHGQQAQLYVRIDLTRLNEEQFRKGGALVDEAVLRDERDMPWLARIHLDQVMCRSSEGVSPLAIDFGNTHSFAAMWHPDDMPREFDDEDIIPAHELRRPDVFPTAIYFENVADELKPVYHIGFEAIERAADNPRGLVTDLKRWIGKGNKPHIRIVEDRLGNRTKYDIETLVAMYLRALVRQAENVVRKHRIRELGISFPSKFGPDRRRAFDRILTQLAQGSPDLPPVRLVTGGAAIDEANAAVISCVLSTEFQERHQELLERGRFTVAAADWGGGSLDTAVLEFKVDGQLDNPAFSSHYLAIGGDEFFGGDNMTISVMELLLDTLTTILSEVIPAEAWEGLVHAPANRADSSVTQRDNFAALWIAAEQVKHFQSNFWKKTPGGAARELLRQALRRQLVENFTYRLPARPDARNAGGTEDERQDSACRIVEAAVNADQFLIDLDEAWKRPVRADFEGDKGYSIEGRFRQILKQLMASAARGESVAEDRPLDVLVLCGSASRLPLVEPLVREVCPRAEIINDPRDAKRRVAYGIVRYVDAHIGEHELARSSDYTNANLGLVTGGNKKFITVVPACSQVRKPEECHPFLTQSHNQRQPLELGAFMSKNDLNQKSRLELYREGTRKHPPHGHFDLTSPPAGAEQRPSALDAGLPMHGHLRLNGSESQIELYLEIDSVTYGPWPLVPKESEK